MNGDSSSSARPPAGRFAALVAAGILLSRLAGLVRERVFAHYFGNSDAADAFKAAFRIPNLLQNLFGEGVLSASFIPVYSSLLARGRREEADRLAGAILALLSVAVAVLVLCGVLATPWLINLITPGFAGPKRELAVRLVRILFPGAGLLVLSAWCLGILNSHRRFFVSYTAPVVWNLAMIATLLGWGGRLSEFPLAEVLAWGSVVGSALQILFQLPTVRVLLSHFTVSFGRRQAEVRTVLVSFVPVFFSRGAVQISAYVDQLLASLLPSGAVAGLAYAQNLYLLPLGLFGMSVSAAELPLMSSAVGEAEQVQAELRHRLADGLRRISYFVIPSAVGLFVLGDVVTAAVYQTGRFQRTDSLYVWGIIAAAAPGLLAGALARLYASTFYALKDTRTPLYFALVHVGLAAGLGYVAAIHLPGLLGLDRRYGVAGLAASAALASWVEVGLLKRALSRRIGAAGVRVSFTGLLIGLATVAALIGWGVKLLLPVHPLAQAFAVLGVYSLSYFGLTYTLRVPEARAPLAALSRKFGRRAS